MVRSGRGVPTLVVRDLRRLLGNELIEDQNQIIGPLLQGPENAKEGLVIWNAANLASSELTVFIGGLSGETTVVADPVTGENKVLSKTFRRDYLTPGEACLSDATRSPPSVTHGSSAERPRSPRDTHDTARFRGRSATPSARCAMLLRDNPRRSPWRSATRDADRPIRARRSGRDRALGLHPQRRLINGPRPSRSLRMVLRSSLVAGGD